MRLEKYIMEERTRYHGYDVEVHRITTEDDYIATLYRIPRGLDNVTNNEKNKSVVLFAHGMGGSPRNFITLGRRRAPAFYFADRGFDVWIICARGIDCQNMKKHKRYDWNKNYKYWEFSWHDIGMYDVSASIDHILNVTDQKKVFYIGHSAGGPQLLVLLSERPEYNDKIKINVNYGSASILSKLDYPFLQFFSALSKYIKKLYKMLGIYEILPLPVYKLIMEVIVPLCTKGEYRRICFYMVPGLLGNSESRLIEENLLDVILSTFPRISAQEVFHYSDNVNIGEFRKFDWGPTKNMKIYGSKIPPLYNLSLCTCPVAFYYGSTDSICTPEDTWLTMDRLSNVIVEKEIGPKFGHVDFIFSKNATDLLYKPTVDLFNDYDQGKIPPPIGKRRQFK